MISPSELGCCELFTGLSDEELEPIAAIAIQDTFEVGALICGEQQVADRLFILCRGRVQLRIQLNPAVERDDGVTVEEVQPGSVFGWSSLVKQRRFTASARALDSVTVTIINAAALNEVFACNAHVGFVVMKHLAEVIASRLHHTRRLCEQRAEEGLAVGPGQGDSEIAAQA